jgi:hypothetical protein
VVLLGGFDQTGILDLVERIEPGAGAVCLAPPLAAGRAWLSAVMLDGRILTMGGEEPDGIGATVGWAHGECV